MKKGVVIGIIIAVLVVVLIIIFYPNRQEPESKSFSDRYGEFMTPFGLESLCSAQETNTCNVPLSCEGELIDVIGFSRWNDIDVREVIGSGTETTKTYLILIYFDQNSPKNLKEYESRRKDGPQVGVVINEVVEAKDYSESAQALKERLNALEVAENEPIIVKVRNAEIVGYDMPAMGACDRGVSLIASSYKDITFEKIEFS